MLDLSLSRARGIALLDALIAMAALAVGLLGYAHLQPAWQHQAQLVRHRTEALHLAHGALDASRRVASVGAAPDRSSWAELPAEPPRPISVPDSPADYTIQRTVHGPDAVGVAGLKVVEQTVSWHDNRGEEHQLALRAAVAAVPPQLSGALTLQRAGGPAPRIGTRQAHVPREARDLGDGRSVFQPVPGVAWIIEHASGEVVGVCDAVPPGVPLDAAQLDACARTVRAQRIGGHIRFADGAQDDPLDPRGTALNLDLVLQLDSDGHPGPGAECLDDAPRTAAQAAAQHIVRYHCLVHANAQGRWSGRLDLQPLAMADSNAVAWPIGAGGPDGGAGRRVCRYSPAPEGESAPNTQHPSRYIDVHEPLTHQNFLVLPAALPCPGAGITMAHQP